MQLLEGVSKSRLLLYILLLGLLPILVALLIFWSKDSQLNDLSENISNMTHSAIMKEKKQASNMAVRSHYQDADHFYIDKQIESLTFLEPEIESLQKLLTNKNVADDEAIKRRLEHLTGQGNSMRFVESNVESTPIFQETTETLAHPVEINLTDLHKILAKIEGVNIGSFTPGSGRPQLIILDFKLDRKSLSEKNEVFSLNLKLLKREFK